MIFYETKLKGAFVIDVEKREDPRGFFSRGWCQREAAQHNLFPKFAQANISFNKLKGTLRGLHFQKEPHQEIKIVRCTKGAVLDVMVDLRTGSSTLTQWHTEELTEENHRMVYVPEGFAHGYLTLRDNSEVFYLTSEFYHPESEGGIRWDDPSINIEWPFKPVLVSEKDNQHPEFQR